MIYDHQFYKMVQFDEIYSGMVINNFLELLHTKNIERNTYPLICSIQHFY